MANHLNGTDVPPNQPVDDEDLYSNFSRLSFSTFRVGIMIEIPFIVVIVSLFLTPARLSGSLMLALAWPSQRLLLGSYFGFTLVDDSSTTMHSYSLACSVFRQLPVSSSVSQGPYFRRKRFVRIRLSGSKLRIFCN